jgi:hypothetical protein
VFVTIKFLEDLGISLFSGHIRALAENFDLKLADAGIPRVGNLEGTCADRWLTEVPHEWSRWTALSIQLEVFSRKTANSTQRTVFD